MKFDLVRLAMRRACEGFGSSDTFNSANFSQEFAKMAGCEILDGRVVRGILGRGDVEELSGGCHWRLLEEATQ